MGITIDQDQINRVLTLLRQQGTSYPLEKVAGLCPELTWDQVFLAIDYLARTGQVRLTLDAGRTYRVDVSQHVAHTGSMVLPENRGPSETD